MTLYFIPPQEKMSSLALLCATNYRNYQFFTLSSALQIFYSLKKKELTFMQKVTALLAPTCRFHAPGSWVRVMAWDITSPMGGWSERPRL